MTNIEELLAVLHSADIHFVIIGGVAARIRGSAYQTNDLAICYERSKENILKLANALEPFHPRLRGAPENLPFHFDPPTILTGLNFTLVTDLGDLDVLGEVGGIGTYKHMDDLAGEVEIADMKCRVLYIDALIASKKFAGRKKDEPVVIELEAIKELLATRQVP